jgi:regulator of protease activity HflC (stomatin/prohibitin superfamily)
MSGESVLDMLIEDCTVPALEAARRRVHVARLDAEAEGASAAAKGEMVAALAALERIEAREARGEG